MLVESLTGSLSVVGCVKDSGSRSNAYWGAGRVESWDYPEFIQVSGDELLDLDALEKLVP